MPIDIKKPVATKNIKSIFKTKPLISARNEKTHALFSNLNVKDLDFYPFLLSGFRLFNIPPDTEKPPNFNKNQELKLVGVTKSGYWANIEIKEQQQTKEIAMSKIESCFDKPETLDLSFNNITVIAGQIICSGNSKNLIRKNLIPNKSNNPTN